MPRRAGLDDPAHDLLRQAGARRVDDHDVGAAGLLDEVAHREPDVAGVEAGVEDVVEARVLDRVGDRRLDDLDADHLARAGGEREADRADAAVEVEDALVAAQLRELGGDLVQPLGHLGVGLEERLRADQEVEAARAARAAAACRRAARSRRPAVLSPSCSWLGPEQAVAARPRRSASRCRCCRARSRAAPAARRCGGPRGRRGCAAARAARAGPRRSGPVRAPTPSTCSRTAFERSEASRQSSIGTISSQRPGAWKPHTSSPPGPVPNEYSSLLR